MRTILKYPFKITGEQTLYLPFNAQLLSPAIVRGEPVLYAIVDTTAPHTVAYTLRVFGTGDPLPAEDLGHYLGTIQEEHGLLVWHIFIEPA